MSRIRIIGLALVAVFAMTAVAAASASAHEWQIGGKAIVTATVTKSKGTLTLTDKKGGIFKEEVKLTCKGTDEGTVGPGAADTVTAVTATECKTEKGTCPSPTAKATHLPWKTELVSGTGSEVRDTITSGGSGEPGYNVVCAGLVEDECVGNTSTKAENTTGGVNEIFDANSANAKCSRGGANAGEVRGTDLIESPTGGVLTAI
jgi:hypothetical protein